MVGLIAFILALTHLVWGYHCAAIILERWTWSLLLSPAAYFYFGSLVTCVSMPMQWWVATKNSGGTWQHKAGTLAVIVFFLFLLHVLVWGSVPLAYDVSGREHIRILPFIPWPDQPFWS